MVVWQDFIEERSDIMMGKPVFRGTRLTVELVLRELGLGMTAEELYAEYPSLKPEHVHSALLYAALKVSVDQETTKRSDRQVMTHFDFTEEDLEAIRNVQPTPESEAFNHEMES